MWRWYKESLRVRDEKWYKGLWEEALKEDSMEFSEGMNQVRLDISRLRLFSRNSYWDI